MNTTVSRKSFLTSLGAAGLGAGLLRFAPSAAAQDTDDDSRDDPNDMMGRGDWEDMRTQMYGDFTAALATELGSTTADDVDAAIRKAIMSLIDAHVSDEELTKGQAEALKVIVATTDVPIMPAFMGMGMGMGPGMGMMHGGMMHGGMPGDMMPGGRTHGEHDGGMSKGRGRMRIRERMGDGGWGDEEGDASWAPDAPDQSAPAAPATPEAGA